MTGKSFLRVCLLFACVVFLVSMLSSNVLADDINTASQPDATTSETETTPTSSDAVDVQVYLEIEDLKQEIEKKQALIEENQELIQIYHNLYTTWTGILGVLLTLFGVIIPLALPFVINKINKKSLEKDIEKIDNHSSEQYNKLLRMQNAMMLSSQGLFEISNQCFKQLKKKYPDDPFIKIYMAKNSFKELMEVLKTKPAVEYESEIYSTANAYIDWFYESDSGLIEELMIGDFYGDSTVIEVCLLVSYLADCHDTNASPAFISLCKKACKYILDVLGVKNEEELLELDQTDVSVMNYKMLQCQLSVAYYKCGRSDSEDQLNNTIKLYSIDSFSKDSDDLKQCLRLIESIKKSNNAQE